MKRSASRSEPPRRRRAKVSVTIDPALLEAVDRYVQKRDGMDRSKVMESALENWYRARQEEEMIEQFSEPGLYDSQEFKSWKRTRRAAAARVLNRPGR